jgi:RES domain
LTKVVRVVEAHHVTSTRKLVDTDAEQAELEKLLDVVKPSAPNLPRFQGLHFLLFTPFRYPPLRNGSRFGSRNERSIWYGALSLECAFAEVAYYRLLFFEGTRAKLPSLMVELTAFEVSVVTKKGVDLTQPPFESSSALRSKHSYKASQTFGRELREAGVEAFLFASARDPKGGSNVGLFEPVLKRKSPSNLSTWVCSADTEKVEFKKKDYFSQASFAWPRSTFLVKGKLPTPAP